MKTWDPAVHGMEVILPDEDAGVEVNKTVSDDVSELSSDVTSLTVREDNDESTEVPVNGLDDDDSGAIVFTMKMKPLSAEAQAKVDQKGNYTYDGLSRPYLQRP